MDITGRVNERGKGEENRSWKYKIMKKKYLRCSRYRIEKDSEEENGKEKKPRIRNSMIWNRNIERRQQRSAAAGRP